MLGLTLSLKMLWRSTHLALRRLKLSISWMTIMRKTSSPTCLTRKAAPLLAGWAERFASTSFVRSCPAVSFQLTSERRLSGDFRQLISGEEISWEAVARELGLRERDAPGVRLFDEWLTEQLTSTGLGWRAILKQIGYNNIKIE